MKQMSKRLLALLFSVVMLVSCLAGCGEDDPIVPDEPKHEDYAGSVKLDMNSETPKQEVTVKSYIDGDTTHFYVPTEIRDTGIMKARYIAVNTPESTGKIEEFGKKASNFTKETLKNAYAILVESDTATWDLDSTGERHVVWIWYQPTEGSEWRNLNIEILQNGLAFASNSENNRYGSVCGAAIEQAKREKLNLHSGKQDPDFFYGDAQEITLKELRANVESYNGTKVAFEAVVVQAAPQSVYVEALDEETGLYNGIYIYYGFGLDGFLLRNIEVGHKVRIVGTVSYFEEGDSYQVSGLSYSLMRPGDPDNTEWLEQDKTFDPAYTPITGDQFVNGKVTVSLSDDETKEMSYAEYILHTSVSMTGLKVKDVYTTKDGSSKGAMTLTCEAPDGTEVKVRTEVLLDENNQTITKEYFENKTIDVKGIVDYYKSDYDEFDYQIKLFTVKDVTLK